MAPRNHRKKILRKQVEDLEAKIEKLEKHLNKVMQEGFRTDCKAATLIRVMINNGLILPEDFDKTYHEVLGNQPFVMPEHLQAQEEVRKEEEKKMLAKQKQDMLDKVESEEKCVHGKTLTEKCVECAKETLHLKKQLKDKVPLDQLKTKEELEAQEAK